MHKDMTRDKMLFWRMIDAYFELDDFGLSNNGLRYHGKMQNILSPRLSVTLVCDNNGVDATIYVDFAEDEDSIDGVPDEWEVANTAFDWDGLSVSPQGIFTDLLCWIRENGQWTGVAKKYKEFEQKCL